MREDAAWSPILREQGALEELAAIGVEIIRNARNELYLSMRFLDVALNGLFPVADNSIKGIGTDGTLLSCLLYTSPSPRDLSTSRMPSSA